MTRTEHLLTIVAEECMEVAQRATKALRFGLSEIQPGQPLNNAERIAEEVADLLAVLEMVEDSVFVTELVPVLHPESGWLPTIEAKKAKVERFLLLSGECGTLEPPAANGGAQWSERALESGVAAPKGVTLSLMLELQTLLNRHGMERGSNTPDYILARYLCDCISTYNAAARERSRWFGEGVFQHPGGTLSHTEG